MKKTEWPREYYLIYRIYSPDERRDFTTIANEGMYIGWTTSKKMLKAFMSQRDPNKYSVEEWIVDEDQARSRYDLNDMWKLDVLLLRSNHTKDMVPLFTTKMEIHQSVRSIKKMFHDQSVVCNVDDKVLTSWSIYLQLREEYKEALHLLGYQQEEEEILYDRVEDPYHPDAYETVELVPDPDDTSEAWLQCVLTLESFIKVMEFDM